MARKHCRQASDSARVRMLRRALHRTAPVGPRIRIEGSVLVHDVDDGEAEPLADGVIVGVVARRDFERSGPKVALDVLCPPRDAKPSGRVSSPQRVVWGLRFSQNFGIRGECTGLESRGN